MAHGEREGRFPYPSERVGKQESKSLDVIRKDVVCNRRI